MMRNLNLPPWVKNFYFIVAALFLLWMFFFDTNDFYSQYQLTRQERTLEQEKAFYLENIEQVKLDREELMSNPELLEKFARERYLMKKESEDLYVIVKEDE